MGPLPKNRYDDNDDDNDDDDDDDRHNNSINFFMCIDFLLFVEVVLDFCRDFARSFFRCVHASL